MESEKKGRTRRPARADGPRRRGGTVGRRRRTVPARPRRSSWASCSGLSTGSWVRPGLQPPPDDLERVAHRDRGQNLDRFGQGWSPDDAAVMDGDCFHVARSGVSLGLSRLGMVRRGPLPAGRLRLRLFHLGNQVFQVRPPVKAISVYGMPKLGDFAQRPPFSDRIGRKPQHRCRSLDPNVLVGLGFHVFPSPIWELQEIPYS